MKWKFTANIPFQSYKINYTMNTWWRGIYISMFNTQQRHFDNVNYTSLWSFQLNKTSKLSSPPDNDTVTQPPAALSPISWYRCHHGRSSKRAGTLGYPTRRTDLLVETEMESLSKKNIRLLLKVVGIKHG